MNFSIGTKGQFKRFWDFTVKVVHHADQDRIFILASSVVYSTLISLVPFIAFIASLLSAFGGLNAVKGYVQEIILNSFGSAAESGFVELVESFVENAGNLGVIGLISFLLTSIFLLNRVWVTLNQIYRTSADSNMLIRFARFLTVLVVTTLLLSAYVSFMTVIRGYFLISREIGQYVQVFRIIAPWLFIFSALFLLIVWVPSIKVKKWSGFVGAFWGMLLFRVANRIFLLFVNGVLNYSIIYGSFAAILIFLLWVYLVWVIVFLAAEISYVHQYKPEKLSFATLPDSPMEQISHGIDVLAEVSRHYKSGKGAVSAKELSSKVRVPGQKLAVYLDVLEKADYILAIDKGGKGYIPARPIEDLKLGDILPALCGGSSEGKDTDSTPGNAVARQIFAGGFPAVQNIDAEELISDGLNKKRTRKTGPSDSKDKR